MKNLFSAAVLLMLAAFFITPAFAQKPKSKDDLVKEIATLSNTKKPEDIAKAYQLGKEYVERFGKDKDATTTKIKTFVTGTRENMFFDAANAKRNAEAIALGKEIMAEQPENIDVLLDLAMTGYTASTTGNDKTYADDSIAWARKALQMIEAGKLPKSFSPFKDQAEATGFMYFIDGHLSIARDIKGAVGNVYKAVQFESPIKNSSMPYYLLSFYYENLYAKMSGELKTKVDGKTLSDADFKTESAKVDKVVEAMMDAYARTCKRAEAEKNPNLAQWKDRLTQVYKFKNKTEAGLPEFITYINTMPLPDPGKY